jgi:hypothetical protein
MVTRSVTEAQFSQQITGREQYVMVTLYCPGAWSERKNAEMNKPTRTYKTNKNQGLNLTGVENLGGHQCRGVVERGNAITPVHIPAVAAVENLKKNKQRRI